MLQEIRGYLEKALKTKHTGSALSPMLWLNGIISVPCLIISAFINPPMSIAFFMLAASLIIYAMWQYHNLIKIDPKLVQSEKLQFEMARLDLVARKGGELIVNPVSIEFSSESVYLENANGEDEVES